MVLKNRPIKFVIISPYEEIHSCGVRSLSAYLKEKGIQVSIIFCPLQSRFDAYLYNRTNKALPASLINDIVDIGEDADCIGISLMTDDFHAAVALTYKNGKIQ